MDSCFPNSIVRHGTPSGWRKHQDLGEPSCDPCWRAKSEYDKRRRAAPTMALKNRANATAQRRAYQRLAHLYPQQYAEYYAIEKTRAYKEAGLSEFETENYGQHSQA